MRARSGVPTRRRDTVTVYRDPGPDGYRDARIYRRGERIAPLAFPDREVAVTELLGEG